MSEEQSTWFVSVTPLSMAVGALASISASEIIGRKLTILLSNLISVIGYLVINFSPSFSFLLIGRSVHCLGMGLGIMTSGVYLSEVTTVRLRGPLIGVSQSSTCLGELIGTAICIFLPVNYLALTFTAHGLLAMIVVLFLPRSPHWLLRTDKRAEAERSLMFLRGSKYPGVEHELTEIGACIIRENSLESASSATGLKSRAFRCPLLIFSVLFSVLALGGSETFVFYGPTIFSKLEVGVSASVLATLPWIGFTIGYAGH